VTELERIVSSGQTGTSQAAWRAARAFGIATGGWMYRGFLTEAGPRPELADLFGAREMPSAHYSKRTRANVRDSDATLWFGAIDSKGAKATFQACQQLSRPYQRVVPDATSQPSHIADWIREHKIKVLYVAGNRESREPGIGNRVERFLAAVFRRLGYERVH
jgi:hypothetical protein